MVLKENLLDKLIKYISPNRALKRLNSREIIEKRYRASKESRAVGDWNPQISTINEHIQNSTPLMLSRVMQLIRDFPPFSTAVDVLETFLVGNGFNCDPNFDLGNEERSYSVNMKVKELWEEFILKENFHLDGNLSFFEFIRLMVRSEAEFGESFFVFSYDSDMNLKIQDISPMDLVEEKIRINKYDAGNYYRGIEYHVNTIMPKKYYFYKKYHKVELGRLWGFLEDYDAIDAKYVVHNYHRKQCNQLRGVTPFHSAIIYGRILEDYLQSEIINQKTASKLVAVIERNSLVSPNRSGEEKGLKEDRDMKRLDAGQLEYLEHGEKISFNQATRNASSYKDMDEMILQKISSSLGLPYELISGDYKKLNYSLLRSKRNDFQFTLKPKWRILTNNICQPIFEKFLMNKIVQGDLPEINLNDYINNKKKYGVIWRLPGLPPVDQYKENKASIEAIDNGLSSNILKIEEGGGNWKEVLHDMVIWQKELEKLGIKLNVEKAMESKMQAREASDDNDPMMQEEDEEKDT